MTTTTPPEPRRFPPRWSVDDTDMKLGQACYIVRDGYGHAIAARCAARVDVMALVAWVLLRAGKVALKIQNLLRF
jgi:hypothetical protein